MAIDQYGQIIRRSPRPIPIRSNPNMVYGTTSYRSTTTHESSLWGRFDHFIGNIGNWFVNANDMILGILSIILMICMAIPFIGWLISLGWPWGLIAGIFLGGIAYYIATIVLGIFICISNIILGIIRYIFYSGTTFLVTLAIVGILFAIGELYSSDNYTASQIQNEFVSTQPTKYYCTAQSALNIRSAPNQEASVIGALKPKQIVDVYEIVNGFAKIKYNGAYGYASIKYLRKQP